MKAYIFPGQGAQFVGMGKDLYENNSLARDLFEKANQILGFRITDLMFAGTEDDLKQTRVTQPAIFLHSVILAKTLPDFAPNMAAGHSLGEFSALTACGSLNFEDGLILVSKRAEAMQIACQENPSTMAAVLGLDDNKTAEICYGIKDEIVVPANFNSEGQIVISGSMKGIDIATELLKQAGAKKIIKLNVSGAFHSPLMSSASEKLAEAISQTKFNVPICPIFQNVDAKPHSNPEEIKNNLILQLTSPVLWSQSVKNIISQGVNSFIEVGPGNVLQGLVKKIDKNVEAKSA